MSILVPPLITIPTAVAYRNAVGRTTPLTNIELDQNMAFLHNEADIRLKLSDYNSTTIIAKLNLDSASSSPGGIDSFLLRGLAPQSDNINDSLVKRDGSGNFAASVITATTFSGNATTSTLAADATKLETPRYINGIAFDGTADISIQDPNAFSKYGGFLLGRLALAPVSPSAADGLTRNILQIQRDSAGIVTVVTSEDHGFAVGSFVTVESSGESSIDVTNVPITAIVTPTTFRYQGNVFGSPFEEKSDSGTCRIQSLSALNLPVSSGALSAPADGDIWLTTEGQFNRIDGMTRRVAFVDSDISGTASNVTQIVEVEHGGSGSNNPDGARQNLVAAKSGINEDITGLRNLQEPIPYNAGGTGLTSPGPEGNVLISNGTAWVSAQPYYPVSGMITYFAGENAPTGWLPCFGQLLLKSEYPNLYGSIGLRYTEAILKVVSLDFGNPVDGIQPGFGTERVPSGSGLGETGGFNTSEVDGGSYLRFGTFTNEIHGVAFTVKTCVIQNSVATLTFDALAIPPFAVGGRILVKLSGANNAFFSGSWEVLECTNNSVKYIVPSYARTLQSGSNLGSVQRSRFASFAVNANFANRMAFTVIRGNDSNGGETPNTTTDSLRLFYKDKATGFLVYIGNLYPSTGDPEATPEESTNAYAASWKSRQIDIPFHARNDNQIFEIHQSSVGAEFNSPTITSSATTLEEEDGGSAILKLVGTFPQVNAGDYLIFTGFAGDELWKVNGSWVVTNKTTVGGVDTLLFNVSGGIVEDAYIETVNIPTVIGNWNAATNYPLHSYVLYGGFFYKRIVAGVSAEEPNTDEVNWVVSPPIATGTIKWYTGYPGLADSYGIKAVYFYDIQSEDDESFSFRLPDLRGEFIRGWDAGRGVDPSRPLGSVQLDSVEPHRHTLTGDLGTPFFAVSTGYGGVGEYGTTGSNVRSGANGVMSVVTGYVDGPQGFERETRPRNIALLPCIKI